MKEKVLTLIWLLFLTLATSRAAVEIDGICYNLNGSMAEVTSKNPVYTGSVTIPSTIVYSGKTYQVTSIGNKAFYDCRSLTSVTIPNSVTSIGNNVFQYCRGLTSVTIPNSVTSIGSSAFYECRGLTSVTISGSVTSIREFTFSYCIGLTSITIPNSVTSIGRCAFGYCSGLTSITIPNSVTSIGNNAFESCRGLTSVTIPNSVTSIGENAFSYCSGLTSVTIPNSVTSIGDRAFSECSGLTSITIPNSVTSIGESAFSGCSGLTSIIVDENNTVYNSHNKCNAIIETSSNVLISGCKNTIILDGVTSIGKYAFRGCSGLTSITIPNSVTSIKASAFSNCSSLTSATIPNSVTSIGEFAFERCYGLTSVTIPNSVTSIGDAAFNGCISLTSVTIPNSVTSIGNSAFQNCIELTSIVVDEGNVVYDSRDNCNAIIKTSSNTIISGCKNTLIPNSVTSIGGGAFTGCSGLTSVTIPNSVTSIGRGAFSGCHGLTSVTSKIQEPFATGEDAFYPIPSDAILYVPAGTVSQYRALADWNRFTDLREIEDEQQLGDATHWKLDPTLTTNTQRYEFGSLDALLNYLFVHWIEEDVTVSVADATYTMNVIPTKNFSNSSVETMLDYLQDECLFFEKYIAGLAVMESHDVTVSMVAPQMAVFHFNLQNSQAFRDLVALMSSEAQTMLAQGMSQNEVDAKRAQWEARLAEIMNQFKYPMQELISYLKTTNITIIVDGIMYRSYDNFQVEANDLLALKNMYNAFGGSNWTAKKWSFASNGKSKDDFPGVTFNDNGRVTGIYLNNNNLHGKMFAVYSPQFSELDTLELGHNGLTGDVALLVRDLTKLRYLDVSENCLTELSEALSASVNYFTADNQDCLNIGLSLLAWVSRVSKPINLPSLFLYNYKERNFTNKPNIRVNGFTNPYHYYPQDGGYVLQINDQTYPFLQDYTATGYVYQGYTGNGSMLPMMLRYVEGDADMNCITDVLDVQLILNYILNPSGVSVINYCASNNYYDKVLNVQDIVATVNIILGQGSTAAARADRVNETTKSTEVIETKGVVFSYDGQLLLSATRPIAAIDVELEGVSTDEVGLMLPSRDFQMIGRNTEWGSRYIIFSPTGKSIPADTETPLLRLAAYAQPVSIMCSDPEAQRVEVAIDTTPTGISVIENGRLKIENEIYDLQGRRIESSIFNSQSSTQKKGLYIQNGKKRIYQ